MGAECILKNWREPFLRTISDCHMLSQEWVTAARSDIAPFQKNIEKNWTNRAAVVNDNSISLKDGTMILPTPFNMF